ncbi:MAG: ABC transporter ATP-binding protein [Beijerinckiaceae bacterium]|nr:ABC transporter ATP-binding protein [Beijerinckiaceae bacterium]
MTQSPEGGAVPAVQLNRVSVAYGLTGGGRYEAVQPVDVRVADGEFVAVLGPTGCGKSTLLNIAAGLMPPSSGESLIFGQRLQGLNTQAGYLFQQDALMPWKTARDNVAIGLEVRGTGRREALAQAEGFLAKVGLASFGDRYPHQLSGGQKKRVALAQVLVREPKILLMDEPFGPLDAQTRLIMSELLLDLWQADRKAVMFVTHDLDEAIALSDRVLVMSAGPRSSIIGDFPIPLARPRDIAEVRSEPEFHRLHAAIWNTLRDEVRKTYGLSTPAKEARA